MTATHPPKRRSPLTADQQDLAERYLPLARSLAKPLKMAWPTANADFESAACFALVEAAQSFDPKRNVKFATFARYRIRGALRDVQRSMAHHGYADDPSAGPRVGPLRGDSEECGRVVNSEPDEEIGRDIEAIDAVERWLKKLPPRHAEACRQIYIHGKNQNEAADWLACSKSRLSYLHKEALEILNGTWDARIRGESSDKS